MEVFELLYRFVRLVLAIVLFIPIYEACKKSLLEELERRKDERERKKNG